MRVHKYLLAAAASVLLCACLPPNWFNAPAPAKRTAPAKLSAEDEKTVERLYYKAVGAYSNNDMSAALGHLDEISRITASYAPAAELRGKIKSIGVKTAPRTKTP